MKNRLNLYLPEFQPRFEWITFSHMILLSILAFGACTLSYLYLSTQHHEILSNVNKNKQLLQQQESTLQQLTQALTQRKVDPVLVATLEDLNDLRTSNETLLAALTKLYRLQQQPFSELFSALAEVDTAELWLTSISAQDRNLLLEGELATPIALPVWIRKLSTTEYFIDTQFQNTAVTREDDKLVFSLQTLQQGDFDKTTKKNSTVMSGGE